MTFSRRDSNAIFEGKIAQLCMLVKLTIFIVRNSDFELCISSVIFSYYVENFLLHRLKLFKVDKSHKSSIVSATV